MPKASRYLKLRDNHPTMEKLQKLMELAHDLKISISFNEHGPATIHDAERDADLPPLMMQDLEDSTYPMECFPPTLEFKVIYENPVYLEEKRKEEEEERLRREQEDKERRERAQAAAERELKRRKAERISELKSRIKADKDQLSKLETSDE